LWSTILPIFNKTNNNLSSQIFEHLKKKKNHDKWVWNPGPGLDQAQIVGGVKVKSLSETYCPFISETLGEHKNDIHAWQSDKPPQPSFCPKDREKFGGDGVIKLTWYCIKLSCCCILYSLLFIFMSESTTVLFM
jgi:hypothetical protein